MYIKHSVYLIFLCAVAAVHGAQTLKEDSDVDVVAQAQQLKALEELIELGGFAEAEAIIESLPCDVLSQRLPISNKTPLEVAQEHSQTGIETVLVNKLYNAQTTLENLENALIAQDSAQALGIIQLAPVAVLNQKLPSSGTLPVFFALEKKQASCIQAFVGKGVCLESYHTVGHSVVHYAAKEECSPSVFETLVQKTPAPFNTLNREDFHITDYLTARYRERNPTTREGVQGVPTEHPRLMLLLNYVAILEEHGLLPADFSDLSLKEGGSIDYAMARDYLAYKKQKSQDSMAGELV